MYLSYQQARLLDCFARYERAGLVVAVNEAVAELGLRGFAAAAWHVRELRRKGLVQVGIDGRGSVRVTPRGMALVG